MEAADVVATSELLCQRLAETADTTFAALQAGDDLLSLRDDLIMRREQAVDAQLALDDLFEIADALKEQGHGVAEAHTRVEELLTLKDTVVHSTSDLAQTIESLQVANELSAQFNQAIVTFERIRHWMVEVVATEPLLERARQTLQPLTELGNLRHLPREQLLSIARRMIENNAAQMAAVPQKMDSFKAGVADTAHAN